MKNKIRIIFQSIFLALIVYVGVRPIFDPVYAQDFEAYCPFGGISSFFSKLELGTMSCQMSTTQVALGFGLILGVILFGKLFCSYVCPLGTISEWLGKLGKKLKIRFEIPTVVDRPLRALKYILLFITIYYTMTMSELFCKTYDPYFFLVNLFENPDIEMLYAVIALAIFIFGSIFTRLFWCKYMCPLGAISNVFLNIYGALGVIIIFAGLKIAGVDISYVYLLGGLVLVGLLTEVIFKRSFTFNIFRIHRDNSTCNECGLCEIDCPQGIDLTKFDVITDSDCNLCSDCIKSCKVKHSLSLGKTKVTNYLAPIATVVLIALSLWYGSTFEFATLSERWGNFEKVKDAKMLTMEIKSIKCYGSASSFKSQIQMIPGILGVDAYASAHKVNIFYNPAIMDEHRVKEVIFTPARQVVNPIKKGSVDSISVCQVDVLGLFDNIDYANFAYALKKNSGIFGYTTEFGEPVIATIYFDEKFCSLYQIERLIKAKTIKVKLPKGYETRDIDFEIEGSKMLPNKIDILEYQKKMFKPFSKTFNKYKTYTPEQLSVYVFPMPEAKPSTAARQMTFLMSHLSNDSSIVRLATNFTDEVYAYVFFNPAKTTVEKVREALMSPKITVTYVGGKKDVVDNPFKLNPVGVVVPATEVNLPDVIK